MWRLVLSVVLWNTISSQPVTENTEHIRQSRQIDFVKCCPCPGTRSFEDFIKRHGADALAAASDQDFRASSGDCPCRFRSADAEGAPSILFPNAVRPPGPVMRSDETKDDLKPLLHPEVGLASSMLETLRAVTDEEYQEALARDAARNEARVSELRDSLPETAKNILTIIVNPNEGTTEDAKPEASSAQETRCAAPLASKLGYARKNIADPFTPQDLQMNSWDMDTGASNVQEQKASLLNTGLEGLKLKASPSVLNFFSTKKPDREHVQSLLKLKNKNNNFVPVPSNNKQIKLGASVPTLKLPSLLNKEGQAVSLRPLASTFGKFDVLNLKKTSPLDPKSDATVSASSISQEQFLIPKSSDSSKVRSKTLLKSHNLPKTTLSLTNLLNLKDVELIPPKPNKPFTLPDLNLPPLRINTPYSLKQKSKTRSKATKKCDSDQSVVENRKNVDKNNIKTQILDTLPKPSEINVVFNNFDDAATETVTKPITKKLNKSEIRILDAMPSPSENIDTVVSFTDSTDDDTEVVTKPLIKKFNKSQTRILDAMPSPSENTAIVVSPIDSTDDYTEVVPQISKTAKTKILDTLPGTSENSDYEAVNDEESHGKEESNNVFNEFTEYVDSDEDGINSNNQQTDDSSFSEFNNDNESISFIINGNENTEVDFVEIPDNISEINIDDYSSDEKERDIIFEIESSNPDTKSDSNEIITPFSLEDSKFQTKILANNQKQEDNIDEDNLFKESTSQFEDNLASLTRTNNDQLVSPSSNEYLEVKETPMENSSFDYEEPSNKEPKTFTMLGKDDTTSVKQSLAIKLQTLKNSNSKVLTVSRFSRPELEQSRFGVLSSDISEPNVDTLTADSENHPNFEKTINKGSNEVNNNDLSHSDSLNNNIEHGTPSVIVSDPDIFNNSEMETLPTLHVDTFESFREDDSDSFTTLENTAEMPDIDMEGSRQAGESFSNNVNANSCPSGFDNVNSAEEATKSEIDASTNEMEAGASESIFNTLPTSALPKSLSSSNLRQSILEPSSLFDGNNIFNPIPALPNLPTLEDIREDISKLIGENERNAKENFSDNFEDAEDCLDNQSTMATDASTTNSKFNFPRLKSSDNVNLDIFQIKPLGQGHPLMPTIPSLNLNSFNTKLALPKSLDLKPIKLQSAFSGKKGDLVGASLTFGPKKVGISRNTSPLSDFESILSNQGLSKLGNPLQDLPNLSEISSAMRDNAKSLFDSPIVQQIQSPIEDTLRTSHSLGNSLRSHTENTVKNLQQSLASTLNEASVTNLNKGGGKLAKPEDLLEHLASAREDMNDKLHAIHIDFKDRLETLHDHITEQTNLPMLNSPLLDTFARIENSPLSSSLYQSTMPSWMQSTPKSSTKKTNSRKESTKPKKSSSKTKSTQSRSKIAKDQPTLKPFRMSKAASSLTPKKVEVPKLTTTSAKPPFSKPLIRDDKVKLKKTAPLFAGNQNTRLKSPRKQFKPFGDFKVTFEPASTPNRFQSKPTEKKSSGFKSSGPIKYDDASVLASEPKVSRVSPPKPKPLIPKLESIPSVSESVSEKPKITKNPLTSRAPTTLRPTLKLTTPLPFPKVTESPLLARMRDSIRIKLSERTRNPTDKLKKTDGANDMARAASENTGVVVRAEPMKENVSYKCKMVCVRE